MKSSSGQHYIALDHVRAVAALMVFTWHFTHAHNGFPVPFEYVPAVFPLALLDEGHTGVSLFMALSGYLFAKLLDGRSVHYGHFFWNRLLRLAPLLLLVMVVFGVRKVLDEPYPTLEQAATRYLHNIAWGAIYPTWPNGGWSITVELHFYLLLPLLLWLRDHRRPWLLGLLGLSVAFRLAYMQTHGEVQSLAYWTIVGRVDQFVLGIVAFEFRAVLHRARWWVLAGFAAFCAAYWQFDRLGGYHSREEAVQWLWTVLPLLEGAAYGALIACYDTGFKPRTQGVSALWAKFGEFSYSIYLLHGFLVFWVARLIHTHVYPLSNFYVAAAAAFLCFLAMYPIGWASFRWIESPFLKYRTDYMRHAPAGAPQAHTRAT